jgi:hypothetical protein
MAVARILLALLVALSVAMLPAAGGAAMVQKPAETSVSEPMHDCCPGHTDQAMDCASMAGCALKCFSFSGYVVSELGAPLMLARVLPVRASQAVHSRAVAPPFRPPRG